MPDDCRGTILVIDNDDAIVRALKLRLTDAGYRVLTAQTGAQGLAEYSLGGVDLIITDLNMPNLDGVGLIARIRAHRQVPIIVVTGFRREYAEQLRGLKDVVIVRKPFEARALLELVETELAMRAQPAR